MKSILRGHERFALYFFLFMVLFCTLKGYRVRFFLFIDMAKSYALLSPIFLLSLSTYRLKNPPLRIACSALSGAAAISLGLILAFREFYDTRITSAAALLCFIAIPISLFFLSVFMIEEIRKGISVKEWFFKTQTGLKNILGLIRDWLPLFLVIFTYLEVKVLIPLARTHLFDATFNAWDFALFLKRDPIQTLHDWIPRSWMPFLSLGYTFYFPLQMISFSVVYAKAERKIFYQMTLAFAITYAIGLCIYYLTPSLGPIYFYPDRFASLGPAFLQTQVFMTQQNLWTAYEQMRQVTPLEFYERSKIFMIVNGIAAFPSLHLAISTVLLSFLFRHHRLAFLFCLAPATLMTIATVYFGWHYVVDDIAGFALAGIVLWLVLRKKIIRVDENGRGYSSAGPERHGYRSAL